MTDEGEPKPGESSSGNVGGDTGTIFKKRVIFWYSIVFAIILAAISIIVYYQTVPFFPPMIKMLIWVTCSGGIGGFIYNAMAFSKYSRKGENTDQAFKSDQYFSEYILRPITAAFLGLFVFFLVAGGLMSLGTSVTVQDISGDMSVKTILFYCALSFLAGWANNKVIRKMDDITTAIFAKDPSSSEPEVPASKESIVVAAAAAAKSAEEAAAAAKVAAEAAKTAADLVKGDAEPQQAQSGQ